MLQYNSVIVIIVTTLLLVPYGKCRDWYLSSSTGSDDNDGLTSSNPLLSLQSPSKLNGGASLASGDRVFLKNGDVFPGSLYIQVPSINVFPYGDSSAIKPQITGGLTIPASLWQGSGPLRTASLVTLLDETYGTSRTKPTIKASSTAVWLGKKQLSWARYPNTVA